MTARPWMFLSLCGLMLIYEVVALYQGRGHTISEIIWAVSTSHPLVPFVIGGLMGHFFWQSVHKACASG